MPTRDDLREYRWEELEIGLAHEFSASVTAEMVDRFRNDTGDCNPLHMDPVFAAARGYRAPLVFGLLTASFYSTLAGVYLPGRFALLHGVDVSFLKPVFVGDALSVSGQVAYRNEAFRQAHVGARITNQHGEVVSRAKIRVGVLESAEVAPR